ncbi:uncharacterized protein LOC125235009 [Leguminivora glycinivorella]|uniref:uncharacterized protein LOC125235009 n=1 Tax=Leguminivora glycinivorella TaxID=1035111 RepID=UPI00200EEFD2|nr:uncharacterized protein LOC125235009 [Leguminivora glycinivorella]
MTSGRELYMFDGYVFCFANSAKDVTFAQSQRGGRLLIFKGYSYSLQKFNNNIGQWRCTMVQPGTAKRCTAKLFTGEDFQVLDDCGEFIWTNRGGKHPLLLFSGYTYSYQKENALGRISWYCSRRLKGCRASAVSYGTRVFAYKPHDHPPPKITMGTTEAQKEADLQILSVYTKTETKH